MTINILGYATHVTDSVFRELLEYGALEFLQVYFYLFINISVIFVVFFVYQVQQKLNWTIVQAGVTVT